MTDKYSYGVEFITDKVLEDAVNALMLSAESERKKKDIHRNVIDPFAAAFEAASLKVSMEDWLAVEMGRQAGKTITNALGHFHQHLIGLLPGWKSTGRSGGVVDFVHHGPFGENQTPAFAEIKNKFNTMNSQTMHSLYETFSGRLRWPEYRNYTMYLIQVIQKQVADDIPWAPGQLGVREDIRVISANRVYELSTGDPNAFEKVFNAVLMILQSKHGLKLDNLNKSVLEDLFSRAFYKKSSMPD